MRSRWRELDTAVRLSTIVGAVGGSVLLLFTLSWFRPWENISNPNPSSLVDNPLGFFVVTVIALMIFTPIFHFCTVIALVFAPLSRETRGILGFLLFIGGIIPIITLLPFLIQYWGQLI